MSEKSKHTPAPWTVANYTTIGTDAYVIRSPDRGVDDPYPVIASVEKRPGYRANAHLIAAAPDLLAALKQLVKAVEYANAVNHNLGIEILVSSARAAIVKAECSGKPAAVPAT